MLIFGISSLKLTDCHFIIYTWNCRQFATDRAIVIRQRYGAPDWNSGRVGLQDNVTSRGEAEEWTIQVGRDYNFQ